MSVNCEQFFGISEFIGEEKGIFGIIKQRFSDFVVNEVSSSGEVVHLTSQEVPPVPTSLREKIDRPSEISDEDLEHLKLLSGQKLFKEMKPSDFLVKSECGKDFTIKDVQVENMVDFKIKVNDLTKDKRKILHHFISSEFSNLNSTTKDIDGEKFLYITKKGNSQTKDRRTSWPKSLNYVNFVLYKENIDTMEAINTLAGKLRLKPGMFSYAGTKDRRGKTSQLVSVYQVPPQNISSAVKCLPKLQVGNFSFSSQPQKLGSAKGNHFKIVLREVSSASPEQIEACMKTLQEKGFINYFGTQRFGTSEAKTHTVGRALLRNQWKEAVDLILTKRESDQPDMAEAKRLWTETRDSTSAFQKLSGARRRSIEGHLLSGLMERGSTDLLGALRKIPRNVQLMYLHAYQSYLWNQVVSKRLRTYKLKVLPGDLVRTKSSQDSPTFEVEEEEESEREEAPANQEEESTCLKGFRFLKEGEEDDISITDVVVPFPGYRVTYPNNETKQWYFEYLQADGLSFDNFRSKVKSFSLGGAYRKLIVRPESFQYSSCFYNDPTKPLVPSDVDILKGENILQNRLKDGIHRALVLEFALPKSTYATMALRELLKMDTSSKFHSSLNATNPAQKRPCEGDEDGKRVKMAV